jgi:hypothetical protein
MVPAVVSIATRSGVKAMRQSGWPNGLMDALSS